jgi:hypothetical protein
MGLRENEQVGIIITEVRQVEMEGRTDLLLLTTNKNRSLYPSVSM